MRMCIPIYVNGLSTPPMIDGGHVTSLSSHSINVCLRNLPTSITFNIELGGTFVSQASGEGMEIGQLIVFPLTLLIEWVTPNLLVASVRMETLSPLFQKILYYYRPLFWSPSRCLWSLPVATRCSRLRFSRLPPQVNEQRGNLKWFPLARSPLLLKILHNLRGSFFLFTQPCLIIIIHWNHRGLKHRHV